ncbi:MAG: trypsin-like peptidase domain-containing protein [Hormoscilla sp. GM7CHS1pb]|nr:trypsin-like peptidase domain-containing protein [Hormoscilla sp. GM7CHS1pb]
MLKKNSGKKYRPGGVGRKFRAMMLLACIGSLLIAMQASVPNARVLTTNERRDYLRSRRVFDRLRRTAEAITVKVLSDRTLGSGILIQQQGLVYTVVTNSHVLRAGVAPYEIKTADGQIYTAEVVETVNFEKYDLALLQFRSSVVYEVAKLGRSSTLQIGDEVFSAGFPFAVAENQEFTGFALREGRVSVVLDRKLKDGYRIGYTS